MLAQHTTFSPLCYSIKSTLSDLTLALMCSCCIYMELFEFFSFPLILPTDDTDVTSLFTPSQYVQQWIKNYSILLGKMDCASTVLPSVAVRCLSQHPVWSYAPCLPENRINVHRRRKYHRHDNIDLIMYMCINFREEKGLGSLKIYCSNRGELHNQIFRKIML